MKNLPKVQGQYVFNESLARYSWFGTGGKAEVLFMPKDRGDLVSFLKNKPKDLPIFILGAGSNLLIRDGGIKGVVILLKKTLNNISINKNEDIEVECGALNSKLLSFCKKNLIAGYEFLGTIPGGVGGSIYMNAGCYGSEIKDKLISVDTIDLEGNEKTYSNKECNFEYRKNNLPKNLIFVSAIFDGSEKSSKEKIEASFKEKLEKRKSSQPVGVKTCGCTFKNPEGHSAWKLIQGTGFQGVDFNGAKMSEKHASFMINTGNATSSDLESLGEKIQKKVKEDTGINLEWEIQRVGEK